MKSKRTVSFLRFTPSLLFFSPRLSVAHNRGEQHSLKDALEAMAVKTTWAWRSVIGKGPNTQSRMWSAWGTLSFLCSIHRLSGQERTEFQGWGMHAIQANNGDKGWLFDATNNTERPDADAVRI